MGKLKTLILVSAILVLSTILTGCGCEKQTTFTVTFNSNGGTKVVKQVVDANEKVKEPEEPTKKGYTFKGWYLDGKKYDFKTKVTKDIKLKAKWSKLSQSSNDKDVDNNKDDDSVVKNTGNSTSTPTVSTPTVTPQQPSQKKAIEATLSGSSSTTINVPVYINLSLKANDYAGRKVRTSISVINSDYEEATGYVFEVWNGNDWVELEQKVKEISTLQNINEKYRLTFTEDDNYKVQFSVLDIETGNSLKIDKDIEVGLRLPEVTIKLPAKSEVDKVERFTVSTKANDYVGSKLFASIYVEDEESLDLNSEYYVIEVWDGEKWSILNLEEGNSEEIELEKENNKEYRVKFTEAGKYAVKFVLSNTESSFVAYSQIEIVEELVKPVVSLVKGTITGKVAEFTVSTTANDYAGTMVFETIKGLNQEAIEKIEYFDETDQAWHELVDGCFGPFSLDNDTLRFRVTFKEAGNYTISVEIITADEERTVINNSNEITIEVEDNKAEDDAAVE